MLKRQMRRLIQLRAKIRRFKKGKRGKMERKKIQSSQSSAPSDDHSARG